MSLYIHTHARTRAHTHTHTHTVVHLLTERVFLLQNELKTIRGNCVNFRNEMKNLRVSSVSLAFQK